jgi:two-component system, OmpR family, phosphate regulon response regulator OmpR
MNNPVAPKPYHLYVVEDDADVRDMLSTYLEKQGLVVTAMRSADDMLKRVNRLRPDLVVLDVGLPGTSGLEACRQLRAQGDRLPIILLTARSEEVDRVIGLEMGADDYLGKPFSARELLARIHAVLRRASTVPGVPLKPDTTQQSPIAIGHHLFVVATRSLHSAVDPQAPIRVLNTVEYTLLCELALNPRVPVSRERLLTASHSRGDEMLLRTVDTGIMRLRRIVEPDPANPRYIQTVRGEGYMFVPDVQHMQISTPAPQTASR